MYFNCEIMERLIPTFFPTYDTSTSSDSSPLYVPESLEQLWLDNVPELEIQIRHSTAVTEVSVFACYRYLLCHLAKHNTRIKIYGIH